MGRIPIFLRCAGFGPADDEQSCANRRRNTSGPSCGSSSLASAALSVARSRLRLREQLHDAQISGLDSLIRPGSETNVDRLRVAGVRVDHGDIRSASDFETLADCDWIIDAAANSSVTAGVDGRTSSRQVVEHNLHGTTNVLEFARHCGAGVVLLSTSRVYSIAALAALPLGVEDEAFVLDATAALPPGCSAHGLAEDFSTSALSRCTAQRSSHPRCWHSSTGRPSVFRSS